LAGVTTGGGAEERQKERTNEYGPPRLPDDAGQHVQQQANREHGRKAKNPVKNRILFEGGDNTFTKKASSTHNPFLESSKVRSAIGGQMKHNKPTVKKLMRRTMRSRNEVFNERAKGRLLEKGDGSSRRGRRFDFDRGASDINLLVHYNK